MKVKASEREFGVYGMFLHDQGPQVSPFCQWSLALQMNMLAEQAFPELYVRFVCPDDSGLSQWSVRFGPSRYDCGDDGEPKFETYPKGRVYDERAFRMSLPAELDEVLGEMDDAELTL